MRNRGANQPRYLEVLDWQRYSLFSAEAGVLRHHAEQRLSESGAALYRVLLRRLAALESWPGQSCHKVGRRICNGADFRA